MLLGDLVTEYGAALAEGLGLMALLVLLALVPALWWAVSGWRTRARGSTRWWAIGVGLLLMSIIVVFTWTPPGVSIDGTAEFIMGGIRLASIFAAPWLVAWGIRGRKAVAGPDGLPPQKGIIYTESEIADFKRRGLL